MEQANGRERAKRVVVSGLLASALVGGWLLVAARASRMVPTECVVQAAPMAGYCTLAHRTNDGVTHTLPWERCEASSRWPARSVGTSMPCWYYASAPDEIVPTARVHVWLTPVRIAAIASALGTLLTGLVLAARATRRNTRRTGAGVKASPYRAPEVPPSEASGRAPLVLVIRGDRGWGAKLLALPFLLLGLVLTGLLLALSWQSTGDIGIAGLFAVMFSLVVTTAGAFGLGYRAGIVADPDRDRLSSWWGLWRPWFYRHYALSSLAQVGRDVVTTRRVRRVRLDLRFTDGERRLIDVDGEVDALVAPLEALVTARNRS